MARVLVISEKNQQDGIRRSFSSFPSPVAFASSIREARKALCDEVFSLVVIDSPLPDGSSRELAVQAVNSELDVILLVPAAHAGKIAAGMERYGVFVLPKPLQESQVIVLLSLIRARQAKINALYEQNMRLSRRLDDSRVICKAKCLLALVRGMDEEASHRYIEKYAMDQRISAKDASLSIITALEQSQEKGES